jgi:maltooligosyltrehalose trehalohydrolase
LHELARVAASYDPPRVLVAEDERNDADLVLRDGINAVWADDFHHAVRVNLTAERDGYYAAYPTNVETIAETINRGWYYDGRVYPLTHVPRGTPATELAFSSLVYCIQNHDQVGNRAFGTRLNQEVSDEAYRAAVMLLLFLPTTSLLFMGQEWAASTPFLFFTDHGKELGELISRGRREEFKRFAAFADPEQRKKIPDPQAPNTFENSRLDWEEVKRPEKQRVLELHRRLLELRRQDPVLGAECARGELSASARGSLLGVLRARGDEARLLLVNFGEDPRSLPAHGARALLSTSDEPLRALERYGAVILAGAARELRGIIDSV